MEKVTKKDLEKQGYRFTGRNSAVKICYWTKKSLINEDVCYKEQFYNIKSHLCCQMTPCLNCVNRCVYCWRDTSIFTTDKIKEIDEPKEIIKNCINEQIKLLSGFGGNKKVNRKKFEEAKDIKHFAISLTGEPTLYDKLSELILELKKLKKSSFLVTNGLFPKILEKLEMPTQLYVSLDAPNKELYNMLDRSVLRDSWKRLNKSLELIKDLDTRTVLRLTLIKGLNMCNEKEYSELIKKAKPKFLELKGYMWVGYSRENLKLENMPLHEDIKKFAEKISKLSGYKVIDEKKESRVVLLSEEDKGRKLRF